MTPQKEFKIASIVLVVLAVLDALLVAVGYFGNGSFEAALATEGAGLFIAIFAVTCILILAKLYMGLMGLCYCTGKGKGKLHITFAKIGVVLGAISLIISVFDMISGAGTFNAIIDDATSIFVIAWYLSLAKKNLA